MNATIVDDEIRSLERSLRALRARASEEAERWLGLLPPGDRLWIGFGV